MVYQLILELLKKEGEYDKLTEQLKWEKLNTGTFLKVDGKVGDEPRVTTLDSLGNDRS